MDLKKGKRTDRKPRESDERYLNFLGELPIPVVIHRRGEVVFANREAVRVLHGKSLNDLVGKSINDMVHLNCSPLGGLYYYLNANEVSPGERTERKFVRFDRKIIDVSIQESELEFDGEKACQLIFFDTTEQKKESESPTSLQFLVREAIERTAAGIIVANAPDMQIRMANSAALNILGKANSSSADMPEELHPENWRLFYPDNTPYDFEDFPLSRAISKGEVTKNIEVVIRPQVGDERWVLANAAPIRNPEGEIIAGILFFLDITEYKLTGKKLAESEKKFRAIFESFIDFYFQTDNNGIIINVSPSSYQLSGYKAEELINHQIKDYFSDPLRSQKLIDELMRYGFVNDFELVLVCRNRRKIPVSVNGHVVYDQNGKALRIEGTLRDVTDRNRTNEALKESEKRFQELFNSVIEGIIVVNKDEAILFYNPAFKKIFEEDEHSDIIGKKFFEYVPTHQKKRLSSQLEKRRQGQCSQYELEIVTARGRNKTILLSVSPRFDKNNNYDGSFSAIMDMTETKQLQELALRAQRLETAGKIAGQVAHDFNNLLGPLMAYPDLIRAELPKNHPAMQYIEDIEFSANQMVDINQQLLTLGRRGQYNIEVTNLNDIIKQAAKQVQPMPPSIELKMNLADDLMKIKGGPAQIFRAVLNLLTNALDAIRDKGKVIVKTENFYADTVTGKFLRIARGEYVKLTVSDTGSGIKPELMAKILEPFFTTKSTTKKRGSGLGLSVVHGVVKDHHGHIDYESTPGKGTSFYLYFPICRESIDFSELEKIAGGTEKILIVDDDQIQRKVAVNLLSQLGYRVEAIENGEKALDYLRKNPRDILILDMKMPGGIDGIETYRQALGINPSQKAIIISGYAENSRVREAMRLGVGAYLWKPLILNELAAAVRQELDKAKKTAKAYL